MHDQDLLRNTTKRKLKILSKQCPCFLPEIAKIVCPVCLTLDLSFPHLKAASATKTSAKPSSSKLDLQRAEMKRNAA